MGSLTGKVAIVTGGGSGVGRGIALALADEGASLMVCGRREPVLEEVCHELSERGVAARATVCDVEEAADLDRLVSATVDAFGSIHILINNAMQVPHGTLLAIDERTIQSGWASGPLAALRLMRRCHPYLCGDGVIVNVSSGIAVSPTAEFRGVYAATKAALNALSRAAATEWGGDGIRVNTIMPLAETEAVAAWKRDDPEMAERVLATVPLGRIGDPERDIGRAVAFLCGPAASYVTGAILPLDGGASYVR